MTLLAVRMQFIKDSGRYDLVTDPSSFADAGADRYIQAGQDWLDWTFEIAQTEGRQYLSVAAGDWYALVSRCRAISEVWFSDDETRWRLEKSSVRKMRENLTGKPSSATRGNPCEYAIGSLRTVPEQSLLTVIDKFGSSTYSTALDNFGYLGLLWNPPSDKALTAEVSGKFFQPKLVNDTDKNFWTEQHAYVLSMAACRALELSFRNIQGVNDWTNSIQGQLTGLEFDLVEQESNDVHAMEG